MQRCARVEPGVPQALDASERSGSTKRLRDGESASSGRDALVVRDRVAGSGDARPDRRVGVRAIGDRLCAAQRATDSPNEDMLAGRIRDRDSQRGAGRRVAVVE